MWQSLMHQHNNNQLQQQYETHKSKELIDNSDCDMEMEEWWKQVAILCAFLTTYNL